MKKTWLLVFTLSLCTLALAWCNKCDCNNTTDENEALDNATQNCVNKGWTHSLIHSQTAVYGECSFPSWIICEDQALADWECSYEADTSNIDTEEKRLVGCQESINNWIKDIENWEIVYLNWENESEAWASFIRNFVVGYSKDWNNLEMNAECIADFVDWSLSVTYNETTKEDVSINEEYVDEELLNETVEEPTIEVFEEVVE